MVGAALEIFTRFGMQGTARWAHVLVGITWIGLLYYFNFVQVPAFAEMEAAARNNAIDKLASRALWWFRWAAVATVASGLLILSFQEEPGDYFKSSIGISISTGMLLGIVMFLNVWGIIWRNQKIVIANARNVQAGGQADPDAPAAGRRALLASRMNAIFSIPMLFFMVGTSHFFADTSHFELFPEGGVKGLYWVIVLAIGGVLEANALGLIGGTGPGPTKTMYESHKNAIITGFGLTAVFYLVWEILFRV